mgnify:CR=1 FL=1
MKIWKKSDYPNPTGNDLTVDESIIFQIFELYIEMKKAGHDGPQAALFYAIHKETIDMYIDLKYGKQEEKQWLWDNGFYTPFYDGQFVIQDSVTDFVDGPCAWRE